MNESRYILLMLGCLVFGTASIEIANISENQDIVGYGITDETVLPNCLDDSLYARNTPVWQMVCFSKEYLGNARTIPFLSALALLPLTFLISQKITDDRRISIFATFLFSLNPIFLIFNDSSAFSQIWAVALLGSIYMTWKKPILSIPLFIFAVLAKPMAVLFFPALLILTWKDKRIFSIYLALSALFVGLILSIDTIIQTKTNLIMPTFERVEVAANDLWFNLTKHTTIITIPALVFSLLHKNRLVQFLIISSVVEIFLLPIFTIYTTYPYRLLPLVSFTAIGISLAARHMLYEKNYKRILARR